MDCLTEVPLPNNFIVIKVALVSRPTNLTNNIIVIKVAIIVFSLSLYEK